MNSNKMLSPLRNIVHWCYVLSKRATSVTAHSVVLIPRRVTGDSTTIDKVWTSVIAREHIVVQIQLPCNTEKTNHENAYSWGHNEKEKFGGKQWPTNSLKLVRRLIAMEGIVPVNAFLERSSQAAELKRTICQTENNPWECIFMKTVIGKKLVAKNGQQTHLNW